MSNAQEFNYGLSIGLGQSSGIFTDEIYENNTNSEMNYSLNALVYFPSTSNLKVQTGIKYFKTGYNVDLDIKTFVGPSPKNHSMDLSYLAIPFNLNYLLPFFSNAYLSGGLEVAYLLSAYSDFLNDDNSSFQENITDQFNDLNVFFAIGIGLDVPMHKLNLFIKPEYTRSINALTENSSFGKASHIETIVLNIGFKL
jgi:hypothetical protein